MAEKKNIPEIRFKGFEGEWEEKKFMDIAITRRGLTYSPSDISNQGVKVLRSSNINEDTFIQKEDDVFVNENAINIDFVKEGDILITSANGSSRLVGKHAIVRNLNNKTVHGGFMILASSPNSDFLNASMSSKWYKNFINVNVSGGNGAIGNLSKTNLDEEIVLTPTLSEQTQIGTYFQNLDSLISLHQRKYDKLLTVKKAMLEKMFPKEGADVPEIRFKGFEGRWEKRELGNEVDFFTGLTYSPSSIVKTGGTFVLRSSNVKNSVVVEADNVFVNSDVVNCDNVRVGDIIVVVRNGSRSLIGKHAQIKKQMNNTVIGAFMTGIHSQHPEFINSLLNTKQFDKEIEKNLGATINQITTGAFKKMQFMFPINDEQTKIGIFFENLDTLILQHQKELEKLKNLKKACLENMFV